jgi:KUP system potassium uptake protein
VSLFLLFDLSFFGAKLFNVLEDGWFTLGVATALAIFMTTWKEERKVLVRAISSFRMPVEQSLADVVRVKPHRIPGTAVFMSVSPEGIPGSLLDHYKLNKVLHETVILLFVLAEGIPRVDLKDCLKLESLKKGFYRLTARYGFMETPNIPELIRQAKEFGLATESMATTYGLIRK